MNIEAELQRCAREIDNAVTAFDVCDLSRNGYPERLLTYYLIQAVARCLERPKVLLEVPIRNPADTRDDNHIDAIVFDDATAFLCEFKRAWAPRHWVDLAADARRVSAVEDDLALRFGRRPRQLIGFYASDCWQKAVATAWCTGTSYKRWQLPEVFRSMTRGSCTVSERKGTSFDGHYLTWALHGAPDTTTAGVA